MPNMRLMPGNGLSFFSVGFIDLVAKVTPPCAADGHGADDHHRQRHGQHRRQEGDQRLAHQRRQRLGLGVRGHRADLHEQLLDRVERVADQHRQQHARRRDAQPRAQLLGARDLPFLARLLQALGSGLLGLLTAGTVLGHRSAAPSSEIIARAACSISASRAGGSSGKVSPSIASVSMILTGKPNAKMFSAGRGPAQQRQGDVGQQQHGDHRAGDLQGGQEHHREGRDQHRAELVGGHVAADGQARRRTSRSP